MIVPMKKVSLLMLDKDKETALQRIRDLGVVHLERKTVTSPGLSNALNRRSQLEIASGILDGFTPKKGKKTEAPKFKGDLANRVIALSDRRKTLQDYIFNHQREQSRFGKWGEFNPKDFAYLAGHGVNAYLYELSLDSYEKDAGNVPVVVLHTDKINNMIRLVAFDIIPGHLPYPLPERPLSIVEERNYFRKYEMAKIDEELTSLSLLKKQLDAEKKSNLADIEFETARAGMEQLEENSSPARTGISDDTEKSAAPANLAISWITGYVPAPDLGSLKRAASECGWAFCADDPAEDDEEVPTKLKNGSFASLIYPVTGFLELVPGYREKDITIWFLLFFTLFFGMIFGDAAYGLILVLISLVFIIKTTKKGVPVGLKLLLLMSLSNFIWGALVCSWFGLDSALVPQFLQNISLPLIVNISTVPGWLSSYNAGNLWIQSGFVAANSSVEAMSKGVATHLMLFCFSIALVQLSIAHISNAVDCIKGRSLKLLSELGRLGMLVGMYFVVLSLVVFGEGFGGITSWQLCSLAGGFVLVFIFDNYRGSLAKSIGASCSNIITVLLNITNVFSDIMSYIRLWAVGLAGASIAGMINSFATPMMSRFVFFVFGLALFAFGHGFNMVLNVLAVLVHGVRLNTLEFSSHVGISWSGFEYKPFAKRQIKQE